MTETIPNKSNTYPRPVPVRPRVTTYSDDRYIAIIAKRNRRATSTTVKFMVAAALGKAIFASTVRRRDFTTEQHSVQESIEENNNDRQPTTESRLSNLNTTFLPFTSKSSGTNTDSQDICEPKAESTWNRTEPEPPMASPSSPVKKFAESTYGVLKRRTKVAKGVQTDEVRKRCWRHSRRSSLGSTSDPNGNDKASVAKETEAPQTSFSSMSTLRSALPSVNFPKWNRGSRKSSVVESLTERYLASLYRPFASVRRQLTEQVQRRFESVGPDQFEAHYLGPMALFLRTVRDEEGNSNSSRYRKYRKARGRHRKKKLPPGWPLCSRGLLIVHLADPDPSILKSGDFYFLATPVGIAIKWIEQSSKPICERSLDAKEFCSEMSSLTTAGSSTEDDDEDSELRRSLLVAADGGIQRVEVGRLLDELLENARCRNRVKSTRDSWVQTEKDLSKAATTTTTTSAAEETKNGEVLQPLAPLASEEEFCSDSEQKQKPPAVDDGFVDGEIPVLPRCSSPVVEVRQLSAVADINQDVLYSQIAIMPGSRDIYSRSVVYISLDKIQLHSVDAVQLAELLLYFQSIPKRDTMCLGFLILVDGRQANSEDWSILYKSIALVEECVPSTVSLVLALHRQNQKSDLLTSRFPIFHIKFEPIVNDNTLLKYVAQEQLLPEFGGGFQYNHEDWINFHEFLDPFIVSCHQTGCRIVKLIQDMRYGQLPSTLTNHLIEEQKKQILEVLENEQLKYLEEDGANFLKQLENYRKDFCNNPDFEEAVDKSKMLYKQLKKVVQRLARLADKRLNKLQECMMMKVFEEESSQVLSWLRRKGEETLKRHKTLAETLNAIREQENEFEKFYFLAMQQIERGNDLLEEIPRSKSSENENGVSAHLRRQLDDFTDRLEDAREKLEDTSRCYHLLDKVYEWALETMRYVSAMKVDSSTSIHALVAVMKRLDSYLQAHPYLEDDVFEEMGHLASKLNNERLISQCQTAKSKYQETVDLVHARRDTLQKAKEQVTCDERLNLNESLDDLKIKPCLWNPLAPTTPHRAISQSFLNGHNSPNGFQLSRESLGSYTSFPSSYYPSPSFKERLLNMSQRKNRSDFYSKRGSLTDDVLSRPESIKEVDTVPSNNLRGRKSFPFSSTDSVNNITSESLRSASFQQNSTRDSKLRLVEDRNWKLFEDELKRFSDEVREQNQLLEQQQLLGHSDIHGVRNSNYKDERPFSASFSSPSYSTANAEEFQKPTPVNSHLMRCASCSDFEELLSSKSSDLDPSKNRINNRTLKLIMMEMVQTERDYVKSLGYIIENYVPLLQSSNVSQSLRSQRNVIFGNIEKIYEFHNCYFLRELEQCESMPYNVGECFLKYETQFYLYALYNKNKPKSDALMAEYGNNFFKKKQQELGDKMDLASYLLKPVQRMGKYALLLKQLLKECHETSSEFYNNLKAAEEMVCFQLRHGNDLLAMDALKECDVNIKEQGRLLRQDEFLVWQGKSKKALRHVFLFEDLILFSKAKRDPECKGHDHYQYKNSIKTSDLGLTAQVGESPSKFEIWFRKCKAQDLYVIQAPSPEVKNAWVEEITSLLWKQAERNRKLRLQEMSSMGIGNKPCLDITPSRDQICDRSISLQQLNKVPRFRNSIAVSSSDNFNNNEPRRRPLSIISLGGSSSSGDCQGSATFYDTVDPLIEVEEQNETTDKRRSMAQQSQCSAESGIFTDLSTSGDSYVENVQRLKMVERSDSVISRTSYTSIEAINPHMKHEEISTVISSSPGVEV